MIFWLILIIAILALAGVLVYAVGKWAENRNGLDASERAELDTWRAFGNTVEDVCFDQRYVGDTGAGIISDELRKTRNIIRSNQNRKALP